MKNVYILPVALLFLLTFIGVFVFNKVLEPPCKQYKIRMTTQITGRGLALVPTTICVDR